MTANWSSIVGTSAISSILGSAALARLVEAMCRYAYWISQRRDGCASLALGSMRPRLMNKEVIDNRGLTERNNVVENTKGCTVTSDFATCNGRCDIP